MRKYFDTVINRSNGEPVNGATVAVTTETGAAVQLYSDNGITPIANPINAVTTNGYGLFQFYVDSGVYNLTYSFGGKSVSVSSVEIYDDAQPSRRFARPVSDSTTDFRDRIATEKTSGTGYIEAPAGNYSLNLSDGPLVLDFPCQIHFGAQNKITINNATSHVFQIKQAIDSGPGIPVILDGHGARIQTIDGMTKTAGAFAIVGGVGSEPYAWNTRIQNFEFKYMYRWVELQNAKFFDISSLTGISNVPGRLAGGTGAIALGIAGRTSEGTIRGIKFQQPTAATWWDGLGQTFPSFGVRMRWCDAIRFVDMDLIASGSCYLIDPQAGQVAGFIDIRGGNIDSSIRGFDIKPGAGGIVQDLTAGGGGNVTVHTDAGIKLDGTGGGLIQRVAFSDYGMRLNGIGIALLTGAGTINDVRLDCDISASTNEAVLLQKGTNVRISKGRYGPRGDDVGNNYGLSVSSGVTGYYQNGYDITGNISGQIVNAAPGTFIAR